MKLNRKIISAVSAAAVFVSMAIPAFAANSYTTSVTYDITSGKANFVTKGYADQNSEVTHIVYEKRDPQVIDRTTIYYVDQTTAKNNGSFSFSYSVAADKAANIAVSVVGTDGANAIPASGDYSAIPGYKRVAVTNNTDKSVTFTQDNVKTIDSKGKGDIYVKAGANVTVEVAGAASFKYRIGSGADKTVVGPVATVSFGSSDDSSITISPNKSAVVIDWNKWGTGESGAPNHDTVVSVPPEAPSVSESLPLDGSSKPGELEGIFNEGTSKALTYISKVNKEALSDAAGQNKVVEYGIRFAIGDVSAGVLHGDSDSVYELQARGCNADGDWAICVMDSNGNLLTGNVVYTACTYVKVNGIYSFGNVIRK